MTLIANSKVSLLTGLNSTKNQPDVSTPVVGGASTFLQALNNTAGELDSPRDFDGLVPTTNSALKAAVLVLDGVSLKPDKPIDAAKEIPATPVAPVADAVWLAHWFQNNSPATVSSPVLLLGSASDPVETALMETSSKPLAMFSSELSSRLNMPISEKSEQAPLILPVAHGNAGATDPAAAPSNAAARWSLPTYTATQATSQSVAQLVAQSVSQLPAQSPAQTVAQSAAQSSAQSASRSTPMGLGVWDKKSLQNLPSGSGHLKPTELLSKVPMDNGVSVKLGQAVGFKDFKDLENGRWLPVPPGSAQVRLEPQVGQALPHEMVGAEAAPTGLGPDAQWASNLAGTANQGVEQGIPLPAPAQSSAPATVTSPLALPVSDKPVSTLVNAPAATPSNVAASLPLPTSSVIQATSQPVSIEVVILDKKSPKNLSIDSDRSKSTEVLSKATMDIGGVFKFGQSVEFNDFKEFKDFENDRTLPLMPGSGLVSLDSTGGQNLPFQMVGTEAEPPGLSPDAQWTSNLADTLNQWVEQSLQLADLTVPDAGQDSLQVRIELKGQEATVYFLTDNERYREAIASQIENLSDRLADQGLKLGGSFVGQGSSQNSPQQPSAHSMLSRRPESEPASAKGLSIDPVLREMTSVPNGRVLDVFA